MQTPQAIKDQDFQIKFRGYDAIEVKAYLELLAEDFFELTEQNRLLSETVESLRLQFEEQRKEKEHLLDEARLGHENVENIQAQIEQKYQGKDKENQELRTMAEESKARQEILEDENRALKGKITALEMRLADGVGANIQEKAEIEKLRARITVLEEQNKELKEQGLDFKTTILAAQKFADNLRQSSEEEARQMMARAKADVQRFREEASAELARVPKEIEKLHQQRMQIRTELQAMLHSYLAALDVFPDHELVEREEDLADLFESILLPDDETTMDHDDINSINMDLGLKSE